jgi:soluble lytic murein transglycosylase-like protein
MAVLAGPGPTAAQVYTFVDDQGVTHFTNQPHQPTYDRMVEVARDAPPAPKPPEGWEWEGLIGVSARQHGLPPALVKAVIAAESDFDPDAVSRAGALGLMQLMPQTALSLGVSDPLRPEENVRGGSQYLAEMINRYGDLSRALAAYNAGPAAVDRYGGIPPYRETRDYVKRVLTYYRDYNGDFGR